MIYKKVKKVEPFIGGNIKIEETTFYDGYGLLDDDDDVKKTIIKGKILSVEFWTGYNNSELHKKEICINYEAPDSSPYLKGKLYQGRVLLKDKKSKKYKKMLKLI
jgi:hypothetical protein